MVVQYPCLGIAALGLCSYNPAAPSIVYFGIGEGLSALGLTLAIQQFLKPLYLFRLRAYAIQLRYLFTSIFCGFLCVVVAALQPNLPSTHARLLEYPIIWELAGGLLIAAAYGMTAYISSRPVRVHSWNLLPFVRAAGRLLSEATDGDRAEIAEDLSENLPRLLVFTEAWARAEQSTYTVEFERLRDIGAPPQIQGDIPISAFYQFAHRKELRNASVAGTLLALMADPPFCSALVRKCPWLTATMIQDLSKNSRRLRAATNFVQGVARQAIVSDESMFARELDYVGFAATPVLSQSLFGTLGILANYDPLSGLRYFDTKLISAGFAERLVGAGELMVQTCVKAQDFWPTSYMYSLERCFESLCRARQRVKTDSIDISVIISTGFTAIINATVDGFEALEPDRRRSLYSTNSKDRNKCLFESVATMLYDLLVSFANSFEGPGDEDWSLAIELYMEVFPHHSDTTAGMNPLQQRLAQKLLIALEHNMEGWYPAISRVLLAVVGPYEDPSPSTNRTAHSILKDGMYKTLQRLPVLNSTSHTKVADLLPVNVSYDSASNSLIHTYSGGSTKATDLSALSFPTDDIFSESNWQVPLSAGINLH